MVVLLVITHHIYQFELETHEDLNLLVLLYATRIEIDKTKFGFNGSNIKGYLQAKTLKIVYVLL